MRYRVTDTPSLLQADRDEVNAICYICKKRKDVEIFPVLGEKRIHDGAWVWLCYDCKRWLLETDRGMRNLAIMKTVTRELYEGERDGEI